MVPDRGIRSRWGIVIALVGYLTFHGLPVLAQAPVGEWVPEPSPPVERQTQRSAQTGQRAPEPPPVPIRIIKSPSEATDDAAREAKADEHDAKDLNAQIRAASAAEAQWWPAWAGAILTALGTVLLVWTLFETRKANQLARDTYLADQRPWISVTISPGGPARITKNGINLAYNISVQNNGKSPAFNVSPHIKTINWVNDKNIIQIQKDLSDGVGVWNWDGITLFPAKCHRHTVDDVLTHSDRIASQRARTSGDDGIGRDMRLFLVGCVSYTDRLTGSDVKHQTGFIVEVVNLSGQLSSGGSSEDDTPDNFSIRRWRYDGRVD